MLPATQPNPQPPASVTGGATTVGTSARPQPPAAIAGSATIAGTSVHSAGSVLPSGAETASMSGLRLLTLPNGEAIPVPTQAAAVNAGGDPPGDSSIVDVFPGVSPFVTFVAPGSHATGASNTDPGTSASGNSSNGGDGGQGGGGAGGGVNPGGGPSLGGEGAPHHGLSTAIIAILAVVGALLLFILIICACRRVSVAKRLARRKRWFRSEKGASMYGAVSSSGYFRENPPSAHSSFGTNFENTADPFAVVPPTPLTAEWPLYQPQQMAQASESFVVTMPSAAATMYTPPSPTFRSRTSGSRTSSGTYESASSGPVSFESRSNRSRLPVLVIPGRASDDGALNPELGTPLSVRPFSPSERWSFPAPPPADKRMSMLHPPVRTTSTTPDSLGTSEYVTAPESELDPFADPVVGGGSSADGHSDETCDTFESTHAHFSAVEAVCRPFVPRGQDELAVAPGDRVHVVRRFDDGWALAQNLSSGGRGLFPIDCLRMPDQDLDAFLAEKRLGTYVHVVRPPPRALSCASTAEDFHAM
jgi:hypothetical protein